ncbi:MAG TPA: hypothetical protein VN256_08035 [Pyrinomonadaceae bacterium]|nr:hypothetical protein [Pyrinomonadaceae bacterium]
MRDPVVQQVFEGRGVGAGSASNCRNSSALCPRAAGVAQQKQAQRSVSEIKGRTAIE